MGWLIVKAKKMTGNGLEKEEKILLFFQFSSYPFIRVGTHFSREFVIALHPTPCCLLGEKYRQMQIF